MRYRNGLEVLVVENDFYLMSALQEILGPRPKVFDIWSFHVPLPATEAERIITGNTATTVIGLVKHGSIFIY